MKKNVFSFLSLEGRTALVSGASGHIGRCIAKTLAGAGAKIIVHCHNNVSSAETLAEEIREIGGEALVCPCDLGQQSAATNLVEIAVRARFTPDILVNNAARQDVVPLQSITLEDWRAMFAATLDSAFALTQAVCKPLIADSRSGAVVNIASIEGLEPAAGHAHYASAKAAMVHFTRAAALEYGPHNIRVNTVSPGLIHRPGLEDDWPEGVARWKRAAPLTRLGSASDVAKAVLYLASPMSSWVSGTNLVVDGGMLSKPNW